MILALHFAAVNNNPYRIHAVAADDSAIVCSIGPALVRPQDWQVPEGSPHTHRQCIRYGLPIAELLCCVLRMAENATVIAAHDLPTFESSLMTWAAAAKIPEKRLAAWNRPGPERVNVLGASVADASETLAAYIDMKAKGVAA